MGDATVGTGPAPAHLVAAPTVRVVTDARLGTLVSGTYRVDALIAEGGMGSVFAVEHVRLGQTYALKYLDGRMAEMEEAQSRFRREAEISARLRHPAIARVFDFNTDAQGAAYMVMEYVEGDTLGAYCNRRQLPIRDVIRIFDDLLGALAVAHSAGVIHRDLKPSNIMVRRDDAGEFVIKLLDFGISKTPASGEAMTRDNVVMGTPNYMSPEQASGKTNQVDARTDVFSLGVLLYEMLAGRRAFEGDGVPQVLHALLYREPPAIETLRADLPAPLVEVVLKCLRKDPAQRYASVRELHRALSSAGTSRSRRPAAPSRAVAPKRPSSSRQLRAIGFIAAWGASLALAGAGAVAVFASAEPVVAHSPAEPPSAESVEVPPAAKVRAYANVSVTPTSKMLEVNAALFRADAGGITMWSDAGARPRTRALPTASQVTALCEGTEGDVVVGQADGTVSRWDRSLVAEGWHRRFGTVAIDAVASGGDYVAVARGADVELLNADTGRSLKKVHAGGKVRQLLLTPGSRPVLLMVKADAIVALDADARRSIGSLPLPGAAVAARLGDRATAGEVEVQIDFDQGAWRMRRTFLLSLGRKSGDTKLEQTGSVRL